MGISLALAFLTLLGADQETEDALKAFDKGYRNPDAHARAGAVAELARTQNLAIMSKLSELLTADEPPVRIAAAKGLAHIPRAESVELIFLPRPKSLFEMLSELSKRAEASSPQLSIGEWLAKLRALVRVEVWALEPAVPQIE